MSFSSTSERDWEGYHQHWEFPRGCHFLFYILQSGYERPFYGLRPLPRECVLYLLCETKVRVWPRINTNYTVRFQNVFPIRMRHWERSLKWLRILTGSSTNAAFTVAKEAECCVASPVPGYYRPDLAPGLYSSFAQSVDLARTAGSLVKLTFDVIVLAKGNLEATDSNFDPSQSGSLGFS